MKTARKALALLLALIMVAALGTTAFATGGDPAPTYQVTIKNAPKGWFYGVRIFSITGSGDSIVYNCYESWSGANGAVYDYLTTGAGAQKYITNSQGTNTNYATIIFHAANGTSTTKYLKVTQANVEQFARDLRDAKNVLENAHTGAWENTVAGGDLKFNLRETGYFMFWMPGPVGAQPSDGNATSLILVNVTDDVTVYSKNSLTPPTKSAASVLQWDNMNSVGSEVGRNLRYEIKFKFDDPSSYSNYWQTFEDTMDSGLTFDSIEIVSITKRPNGTRIAVPLMSWNNIVYTDAAAIRFERKSNGFLLSFNSKKFAAAGYAGCEAYIVYTAHLNQTAVTGTALKQDNNVTYTYGDPDNNPTRRTLNKVTTWTNTLKVQKYAQNPANSADQSKKLAGATFVLVNKKSQYIRTTADTGAYNSLYANGSIRDIPKGTLLRVTSPNPITFWASGSGRPSQVYAVEQAAGWIDYIDVAAAELLPVGEIETYLAVTNRTSNNQSFQVAYWTRDPNQALQLTTGADGTVTFPGVRDGTYSLREIAAPEGYFAVNKNGKVVTTPLSITNKDTDKDVELKHGGSGEAAVGARLTLPVSNVPSGGILPETGGVGTTIFYILGSCMLLGAAVLLITRRRMKGES